MFPTETKMRNMVGTRQQNAKLAKDRKQGAAGMQNAEVYQVHERRETRFFFRGLSTYREQEPRPAVRFLVCFTATMFGAEIGKQACLSCSTTKSR